MRHDSRLGVKLSSAREVIVARLGRYFDPLQGEHVRDMQVSLALAHEHAFAFQLALWRTGAAAREKSPAVSIEYGAPRMGVLITDPVRASLAASMDDFRDLVSRSGRLKL